MRFLLLSSCCIYVSSLFLLDSLPLITFSENIFKPSQGHFGSISVNLVLKAQHASFRWIQISSGPSAPCGPSCAGGKMGLFGSLQKGPGKMKGIIKGSLVVKLPIYELLVSMTGIVDVYSIKYKVLMTPVLGTLSFFFRLPQHFSRLCHKMFHPFGVTRGGPARAVPAHQPKGGSCLECLVHMKIISVW